MNTEVKGKLILNENHEDLTIGGLMYVTPKRAKEISDVVIDVASKILDKALDNARTPTGVEFALNADDLIIEVNNKVTLTTMGEVMYLGIAIGQAIVGLKKAGKKAAERMMHKHAMEHVIQNHPLGRLFKMFEQEAQAKRAQTSPTQSADNSTLESTDDEVGQTTKE